MEYTVKELPASERPRERLRRRGLDALSDAELLALVLRSGMPGKNVVDLSQELLMDLDLSTLSNATLQELQQYDGIGEVKAGQVLAVFELARRFGSASTEPVETITGYTDAVSHLGPLQHATEERFGMLTLNARNHVLGTHLSLFRGSINSLHIEPRVIVKTALQDNAAAIILAHNHPSGEPEPSPNDIRTTEHLTEVLANVDIEVLDHIVVGADDCSSMRKDGLL